MMDMNSRNQYLRTLKESYLKARKKEKTKILDEYIKNTGHHRKYVISKLNDPNLLSLPISTKRNRKLKYPIEINIPLAKLWEIFDYACGQRLKPLIEVELERLREFKEINISDELAKRLKSISSATIDRRLKHNKKVLGLRRRTTTKPGSLLKAKIPLRLTQWDTNKIGYLEVDLVAHCGSNNFSDYINTINLTDIASGWCEAEAIMGKGQRATFEGLKLMRLRTPFVWKGLDSDNGGEFINHILYRYCEDEKIEFTRSREYKKNDNAYIEQKNWSHIRKLMGYLRYDTPLELEIMNDLYRNEYRLYKNFFQSVMKLKRKERIGGKLKRKYETAKSPYQRMLDSKQIDDETKKQLKNLHNKLNPAELKRQINQKLCLLYQVNQNKHKPKSIKFNQKKEGVSVRL